MSFRGLIQIFRQASPTVSYKSPHRGEVGLLVIDYLRLAWAGQDTIEITYIFIELYFRQFKDVWLTVQFVLCRLLTKDYTKRTLHHGPLFCCLVHTCFTPPVSRRSKNSPWTNDVCVPSVGLFTARRYCSKSHRKEFNVPKLLYKYLIYHFGDFGG